MFILSVILGRSSTYRFAMRLERVVPDSAWARAVGAEISGAEQGRAGAVCSATWRWRWGLQTGRLVDEFPVRG